MGLTPQTAWLPYEPSAAQPWNRRAAAHLFRRAGFAATPQQLAAAVERTPGEVVKQLLSEADEPPAFTAEMRDFARILLAGNNPESLPAWWLYRLLHTPAPLREKLTLFWHGHFATSAAKVVDPQLMYNQNELFRTHALGSFAELVPAVARDPAMLLYLDSASNTKRHPNENFAREVMELFCLGLGNYSEQDIRELARCFTGWETRECLFRVNERHQDTGRKQLLGQAGDFTGEEGLAILLQQPAMPQFVCTKLVRYFVTDEEPLPPELIAPLAKQFRAQDLQIAPLVETILTSRYFYSQESVGRKIRSPVELAIGLLRSLSASVSTQLLAKELAGLGQKLFYPPNVKGWDGGLAWLNSDTLIGRANLARHLLGEDSLRLAPGSLTKYVDALGWRSAAEIVDGLCELWLATELAPEVRTQLIVALAGHKRREKGLRQLIQLLAAQPEFQLA